MRRGSGSFASRFALYGCFGSVAAIALVAALCRLGGRHVGRLDVGVGRIDENRPQLGFGGRRRARRVQEELRDGGGAGDVMACEDIFLYVKEQANGGDDDSSAAYDVRLCDYARECDGDFPSQKFLPLVLCHGVDHEQSSGRYFVEAILLVILPPILLVYMILLFRLLATTADSYFSPALETFSFELGLPPRFAGATLLALGNGSPDLGSTVNAILLWNEASATIASESNNPQGWTMSLGALEGGGMFVGTIVCGLLIQCCSGITCRWAFIRDVSFYALSICVVWYTLESGMVRRKDAQRFLWMYLSYVIIIFCSDMYHRKVTLHRLHKEGKQRRKSLIRKLSQLSEEENGGERDAAAALANEATPLLGANFTNGEGNIDAEATTFPSLESPSTSSENLTTESGKMVPRKSVLSVPDRFAMLMSNYDPASVKFDYDISSVNSSGGSGDASEWRAISEMFHDVHPGIHSLRGHPVLEEEAEDQQGLPITESLAEQEEVLSIIDEQAKMGKGWSIELFLDAYDELVFRYHHFLDSGFQSESSLLERICLFLELPFVAVRTVTIPVPCEEHYCRPILALSIALSPLWVNWYLDTIVIPTAPYCLISFITALAILRYAEEEKLPLYALVPISLYGFFIAATWIDTIADALVGLLQFLGTISRIPSTILGLTVLAWGNSMGDLSANLAMAKKGMPDMATTGCFAGPSFNLLVGTGLGFLYLQYEHQRSSISPLQLTPAIRIGFTFIIVNCLTIILFSACFNWRLPYRYSFFLFGLYVLFIATSLEIVFGHARQ